LVHAVADLERIGDLAENIAEYARQDKIVFSDKAGPGEALSGLFYAQHHPGCAAKQ
jgi:phosphate uptake regulator